MKIVWQYPLSSRLSMYAKENSKNPVQNTEFFILQVSIQKSDIFVEKV